MIRAFLDWWWEQLAPLVPATFGGAGDRAGELVCALHPGPAGAAETLEIRRRAGLTEIPLGRVSADPAGMARIPDLARRDASLPVSLVLPDESVLARELSLPLAAEGDLARVVGWEIDRETPFDAGEVHYDIAVGARDTARSRVAVRLALVPRALVDGPAARMAALGIAPTAVEGIASDGRPARIRLAAAKRGPRLSRSARRALAALLAAAVILPGTAFLVQEHAASRVEARLKELRAGGGAAPGDAGAALAGGPRAGDVLALLAELTEAVPDHSHLLSLRIEDGKLMISGRSGGATELLSRVAAAPHLRDAAFAAPVTRLAEGDESFTISATVAP